MEEMNPHEDWPPSLSEVTANLVAVLGVCAIIYSAVADQNPQAAGALTGVVVASSGFLFKSAQKPPSTSNGNGKGPPPNPTP